MKVIEKRNGWSYICECKECESKLEINKSDLFTVTHSDYGGGEEISVYFKCVVCNTNNEFLKYPNAKHTYPTRREWEENQSKSTNR